MYAPYAEIVHGPDYLQFVSRRYLLMEILALRHQLSVSKARNSRPRLTAPDRVFLGDAAAFWSGGSARLSSSSRTLSFVGIESVSSSIWTWRSRHKSRAGRKLHEQGIGRTDLPHGYGKTDIRSGEFTILKTLLLSDIKNPLIWGRDKSFGSSGTAIRFHIDCSYKRNKCCEVELHVGIPPRRYICLLFLDERSYNVEITCGNDFLDFVLHAGTT